MCIINNFTKEEYKRLKSLLYYSQEAMEYWFAGSNDNDEFVEENNQQKRECVYFIQKLNELTQDQ